MRAARPYEDHGARHGRLYLYAFGCVAACVFFVSAYVHSHHHAREMAAEPQVAQGAVLGTQKEPVMLAVKEPANAVADASAHDAEPPGPMPTPVAVPMPPPETVPPPVTEAVAAPPRTEAAQQDAASFQSLRDEQAAGMKREVNAHADVARNLAIARVSLDKNNLGPARRSIMTALTEQPGNGAARQMHAELVSREQERDALLGYARLCARQADWVCAWQNAGHALTIDASNSEARNLLSHAMAEQNARGEKAFDPSLDPQ
ncbi:hypothetical protein [Paraburkholderia pallida]|uniref:Uncharacterized protein n=1 Tax=Paraburkholderia pallida TaxID=2547399 RepID=A0A4P7CXN4_9BURK|nr:hypothetical protein [Paraburkholderia pallida]QBR01016.1 hypothetical protein E1956_27655 [Paraburkholderia pallida]